MFDVKQFLTRTPWWAIPSVWVPVVGWLVSISANRGLPSPHLAATLVAGIFTWTLLEYSLHRFLFHMKPSGYWYVPTFICLILSYFLYFQA